MAPMAGITDVAFRLICKKMGAGLCCTEMISANALSRGNAATIRLAQTCSEERPVSMQLFGQNTDSFLNCIEYVEKHADLLDINLGCPASKIMKQGAGCALLKRKNRVKEIIESLVSVSKIPITVKIRSGITQNKINAPEVAKLCEKAGASAVAIHARTFSQGYSGEADWSVIKDVKDSVSIPVIGNGDIWNCDAAKQIIEQTNCDYIMIGRPCAGNPYLINQITKFLETGIEKKDLQLKEQVNLLNTYFKLLDKHQIFNIDRMRSTAQRFTKRYDGSSKVRFELNRMKTREDICLVLDEFVEKN